MDWSNANSLLLNTPFAPCEAVRLAIAERLMAMENATRLNNGISTPFTSSSLASSSYYGGLFAPSAEIRLMPLSEFCAKVQQAVSALLGAGFINKALLPDTAASAIESSSYAGTAFSSLPVLTESTALQALGSGTTRIQPDKLSPLAGWLLQQQRLLNLMEALRLSPGKLAHDGGKRFNHEFSPWDEEEYGDGANPALAWAELGEFDVEEYSELRWNYIVSASGKAEAFGSVDTVSSWTRRQFWREWSQWTCDFSLLKNAGVSYALSAMQAQTAFSDGKGQATPISRQFSTELFPRQGICAMPLSAQPDTDGKLELEFGNISTQPSAPTAIPQNYESLVTGWKLSSFGPFLAKFDFKFKTA